MQVFSLDLWNSFAYPGQMEDGFRPTLDAYLIKSDSARPAVIVLPGSGYRECSPREAEAVALQWNAIGYHAFVLWYSCSPRRHPVPLLDGARAITIVHEHAQEWSVDPTRIALMGFSAGAHLALSLSAFGRRDFVAASGVTPSSLRADALILCYPVVSSGDYAHRGSFDMLLGDSPDPALSDLLSLEKHIPEDLPPVFLWHTYTDQAVPVENSLLLAEALRRAGIPLEMHIFPEGQHGLSLATPETSAGNPLNVNAHVAQWFPLCANWINLQFDRG